MADSIATGAAPVEESAAQRAARLRREKRSTRITSEGSDRLNKITSMAGRPAPMDEGDRLLLLPEAFDLTDTFSSLYTEA